MNCLKVDPNLLAKKINPKRRDYDYDCLDALKEYNLPINIYYDFIVSVEEFKLKNIWNHIIVRWNKMKYDLRDKNEFTNSEYAEKEYIRIHNYIDDDELNSLMNDFIGSSILKTVFACNCIQNYIKPK
tara:strand:- start:82 stop:465 length:384 start_codon:yes stop_codon:yes gene_type:complete